MYKSFFAKKAQNAIRDHKITVNNLKSRKMPGEPHHAAKHKRALKLKITTQHFPRLSEKYRDKNIYKFQIITK